MNNQSQWRKDACLRHLDAALDGYDILSLDIFDTLVFRLCGEPQDVFEAVGEGLRRELADWPYAPVAYRALRTEVERRARARKPRGVDCTFDEIISEMPFAGDVVSAMRRLEIACEGQMLYLNHNVYSLLQHFADRGKKVILVSDMYHSRAQIMRFLEDAGLDGHLIADCFVSSEHGCFKTGGELFRKVLRALPGQDPARILHIGDNPRADVAGAECAGLTALHYQPGTAEYAGLYDYESAVYRVALGELLAMRKLAAGTHLHHDDETIAFHALGAQVIGPVYALFAHWVVRYAAQKGIRQILPLMREGTLLSKVITREIEATSLDMVCVPWFIARRPAFVASICEENYEERISQTLLRGGRALGDVLLELGLDCPKAAEPGDTLARLKEDGRIHMLEEHLHDPAVKSRVLAHSAGQRRLLLRGYRRLAGTAPALTVDIGVKGTTERLLAGVWALEPGLPPFSHALMMGSKDSIADSILDGIDIVGWLGAAGENDEIISKLKYQIQVIETFVNDPCGSTLGYSERGGETIPLLGAEIMTGRQKEMLGACWDGVLTFQDHWLRAAGQKDGLAERLLCRKADFLNVLLRLVEMPLPREALHLSKMPYLDGYNAVQPKRLAEALPDGIPDKAAADCFIAESLKQEIYWPQAAIALMAPEYFAGILLESQSRDPAAKSALSMLRQIKEKGYTRGVIFGASALGRKFQRLAVLMGVPPLCYVDSNRDLQGKNIDGLPVLPLDAVPEKVNYFVIASYIYEREIRAILEAKYPDEDSRPEFLSF